MSSLTIALADGVVLPWLLDPHRAPAGEEIAAGLRALADAFERGAPPESPPP